MSNGRAMRRKIKGVRGMSRRKKRLVGGMIPRYQLTEMTKALKEMAEDGAEEAGLETDQDGEGTEGRDP